MQEVSDSNSLLFDFLASCQKSGVMISSELLNRRVGSQGVSGGSQSSGAATVDAGTSQVYAGAGGSGGGAQHLNY